MTAKPAWWLQSQAKFEQGWVQFSGRSGREKALIVGALAFALLWVGDQLWLTPALTARKAGLAREAASAGALQQAQQASQASAVQRAQAREQRRAELAQLREQLRTLSSAPQATPLDGARTLALLEALVQRQHGQLRLRAMRAEPDPNSQPGKGATPKPPDDGSAPVYRHGLQLVIAGPYAALHQYLSDLASAPVPLRLRSLSFEVTEHPVVEMTLDIETLSPQAAWLTL